MLVQVRPAQFLGQPEARTVRGNYPLRLDQAQALLFGADPTDVASSHVSKQNASRTSKFSKRLPKTAERPEGGRSGLLSIVFPKPGYHARAFEVTEMSRSNRTNKAFHMTARVDKDAVADEPS